MIVVVLTLVVFGVLLVPLARIAGYLVATLSRNDILGEDEPSGLFRGNWLLWQGFKWGFAWLFLLFRNRYKLFNKARLEETIELEKQGYHPVVVINHLASPDVWMPQLILWLNGFRRIAETLFFYAIGLKFFNRHLFYGIAIRCKDRIPVVPPTMVPKKRPPREDVEGRRRFLDQLRVARQINDAAREAICQLLELGRWLFIAPEGTRQRSGHMEEPDEGFMGLVGWPNMSLVFQTAGLANMRKMWPPETFIHRLRPWTRVEMVLGENFTSKELLTLAQAKASRFGISLNRAAVNVLMYAVAAALQNRGHHELCGVYNLPWEERDWSKKPGEETKEEGEVMAAGGS